MMLTSSLCSMGQFPRASPHSYMVPRQLNRGPLPRVTRAAGIDMGLLDVRGNVGSLQGMHSKEFEAKIRKRLQGVELSPSLYDTAWVAMVPERGSSQAPCYPQCIDWILQNQKDDGSWGVNPSSSSVDKDVLLSTLACVVALKRWNVGPSHIRRGLNFIGINFSVALDVQTIAPVGFNITFSGLISLAAGMGLQLPVRETDIDEILHLRKIELERDAGGTISGRKAFMAYVSEGLGSLQDWNQVMSYQRKNGSLFNSPSTTAAAAIHSFNGRALNYLDSITNKLGGPVPAMYPQDMYTQLCTVDTLERTGIARNFACEIRDILDMTYRCWVQNEEEVMLDIPTCAMAFRLLRTHGYDITSAEMAHFSEQSSFDDSVHGYLNDTKTLLELYRSSQIRFSRDDLILENIVTWSAKLLNQQLSSNKLSSSAQSEVEYALQFPLHYTLDRLEHRRNIEQFKIEGSQVLKSGYCGPHSNKEILALAIDDFHSCQSIYRQELEYFERWVKECRLDKLRFARVMPMIVHFMASATMFAPELAEARMVLSQTSLLVTVYDDLFDCNEAPREEKENFVALLEKWDDHAEIGFYSEDVEILFYAVYNTYKDIGERAALRHNHRIMVDQMVEDVVSSAKAMMLESDWTATKYIPATMEEYMATATVSAAFGAFVCPPLFFVGPELSEEDVKSEEKARLIKLTNVIGRLQNDSQTYRKEILAGKLNSVLLQALTDSGNTSPESIEAGKDVVNSNAETSMMEMRSLVFREGGVIPRSCKNRYWEMCKIVFYFYREDDAYLTPKEMMNSARAVLLDPLRLKSPPS